MFSDRPETHEYWKFTVDEGLPVVNVRSREKTNQLKIYLIKSKDYCKTEVKKVHYLNFYFVSFRLVPKVSASSV